MTGVPYLDLVVAHYRRPSNMRSLQTPTHVHEASNELCGDRLRMELVVRDDIITDLGFQASACAIATASASLLTERLRGATVAEANAIADEDVIAALGKGVPSTRRGCATLALRVLRRALSAPVA